MSAKKSHSPRFVISIALFVAALIASFSMSLAANQRDGYWVVRNPIPAGSEIKIADLVQVEVSLGDSQGKYLPTSINPSGSVSLRRQTPGELISVESVAKSGDFQVNEEISLSFRSVDIPLQIIPGALVSIYQLHDAKNGEFSIEPFQVLRSVQVIALDRKGSNFGGEVALTISTNPRDTYRVLAASTSGRLVAVRSYA